MEFIARFSRGDEKTTGWRKAAKVNNIVLVSMTTILIVCLIWSASRTGGLTKALLFYEGTCDGGSAARLNVALHLLINAVSTAVLASSNFFMQVLNAPSRQEVDKAHVRGDWLGIGVPSVRNAFRVSSFKTWAWVVLLISSIPIHLLFNSTIFDQKRSDFHMTIANEDFANGGTFYPPGASLAPAGFYEWDDIYPGFSYGGFQNLSSYSDPQSEVMRNISVTAVDAARWDKISAQECYNTYAECEGLRKYRDVIVVVDQPDGWVRDDMWELKQNQTGLWDDLVPATSHNTLFFSTQCLQYAYLYQTRDNDGPTICYNECFAALGRFSAFERGPKLKDNEPWTLDFLNTTQALVYVNDTDAHDDNLTDYRYYSWSGRTAGLQPGAANLTVNYCLAEPIARVCHVGLSNILLLAVTLCVLVKTVAAVVVTVILGNQTPLVTLGDAVASFICRPDDSTGAMATVDQDEARRAMQKNQRRRVIAGPRFWWARRSRRWSVVPKTVWIMSYLVFAIGITVCGYMLGVTHDEHGGFYGSFAESDANAFIDKPFTFASGVLTANSPQLLLSFCYLAYNSLFTRLQMAKEWGKFSTGYHPLRVTDPKGSQFATYRLQLPYKYSIPLICISIFLHWLVSQTIYLFISEGGYYATGSFSSSDPSLPANTAVALGYSMWTIFVLLLVSIFLILVPVALSFTKLPPNMVNVGSNSVAISAACHASSISKVAGEGTNKNGPPSPLLHSTASSRFSLLPPPYSPLRGLEDDDDKDMLTGTEGRLLMARRDHDNSSNSDFEMQKLSPRESQASLLQKDTEQAASTDDVLEQLSRSKLRWGVVTMPVEWYQQFNVAGQRVGHLSFGAEEDQVEPPMPGRLYA